MTATGLVSGEGAIRQRFVSYVREPPLAPSGQIDIAL
jgi:hypothetical protein